MVSVRWGPVCAVVSLHCSRALRFQVLPEEGAREHGPGRKTDSALEALQLPPSAGAPVGQVSPGTKVARGRLVFTGGICLKGKPVPKPQAPQSVAPTAGFPSKSQFGQTGQVSCKQGPWGLPTCPSREELCLWHCIPSTLLLQAPPPRPEAAETPAQRAGPPHPSDHSYALLDLDALKKKLFVALKENEKLRKRLKAQRLVMRRMCSRLRALRARRLGSQATPRPEPQS